jgi:uncharacterized protein with FMN-binding domain
MLGRYSDAEEIMARKLNTNLVALGSATIVTIYALGYARTQHSSSPPDAIAAAATATPTTAATAVPPTPDAATAVARAIATAPRTPTPSPTAAAATQQGYRDGTYNGTGTSRRGDVSVAVTIQNGQIAGVRITRSTTYYPNSAIARLPGEVVNRQSAQVDFVSGATESSRAFRGAVAQALSQASAAGAAVPAQSASGSQG